MSWDSYISQLMTNDSVADAVIAGHAPGSESVWAANRDGNLCKITVPEIKALVNKDRGALFANGVSIGGTKCTVLRDNLLNDNHTMDIRTKATETDSTSYSICVAMTVQALVIVQAKKDVHGGKVNEAAFKMSDYLRKSNY